MKLSLSIRHSVTIATLLVASAHAACLSDSQVEALAGHYAARTLAEGIVALTDGDGACSRSKFHSHLARQFGNVIGYKAGLTNPMVQKRFSTDKPVWGRLYEGMLLPGGSVVDARFGARPLLEADLLVRVKSAEIHRASTPLQVLAGLDQIIPFIELPDLVVQDPSKLNGPAISAINVGARLGVTGEPMAAPESNAERSALLDALRDMTVIVSSGDGATLAQGKGADLLEHPLNAVIWLSAALAMEGIAMQPGDLISLGSFSALLPPRAGQTVTVRYSGVAALKPVSVGFR